MYYQHLTVSTESVATSATRRFVRYALISDGSNEYQLITSRISASFRT